jgi:hypothetical protein
METSAPKELLQMDSKLTAVVSQPVIDRADWCSKCGTLLPERQECQFRYKNDGKIDENLLDPVSLNPLIDPVCLPCAHTFSRKLISQHIENDKNCPLCRSSSSLLELKDVPLIIRNMVDSVEILCPFCSQLFQRSGLDDHLKICPCALVVCGICFTDEVCQEIVPRQE